MTQIHELVAAGHTLSYEFLPPRSEAQAVSLDGTITRLDPTYPDFVSITYGANGSTRDTTRDITIAENGKRSYPVMPHLTCVGHTKADIHDLLDTYADGGVQNILALRGDGDEPGDFEHAIDLVTVIKNRHPHMSVAVAAHPEYHPSSLNPAADRQRLAEKLAAADLGITQFAFSADPYRQMLDELDALGCRKPILPGVMLFSSVKGALRIAALNQTHVPDALQQQLDQVKPEDVGKLAVDLALEQIADLRAEGAPGIHLYTMNKAEPVLNLLAQLERY